MLSSGHYIREEAALKKRITRSRLCCTAKLGTGPQVVIVGLARLAARVVKMRSFSLITLVASHHNTHLFYEEAFLRLKSECCSIKMEKDVN